MVILEDRGFLGEREILGSGCVMAYVCDGACDLCVIGVLDGCVKSV